MNKKQKYLLTAAAALACASAPFAAEAARRRIDRLRYHPQGIFAEVGGRKMHVYSEGTGGKTLVFLPGLGTPCPAIDFMPFIARLRGQFRCVVPEPFGYGYSDCTSAPRTAGNIVAEIREGLAAAGFKPPYVLIGHSVAGLYMLSWAAHYPAEIEAVIGDDAAVPEQVEDPALGARAGCRWLSALLNRSGVLRLCLRLPRLSRRTRNLCGGNPARRKEVQSLSGRNLLNRAVVDERARITQNGRSAQRLRYPKTCRLLHFVAQGTIDSLPASARLDWLAEHQKQTLAVNDGRCILLPGGHSLHWTQADAMAHEIRDFLSPPQPAAQVSRVRRAPSAKKN